MDFIKKNKTAIIWALVGGLVAFMARRRLDNFRVLRALPTL
jgi:uncharacterized membrane protein